MPFDIHLFSFTLQNDNKKLPIYRLWVFCITDWSICFVEVEQEKLKTWQEDVTEQIGTISLQAFFFILIAPRRWAELNM